MTVFLSTTDEGGIFIDGQIVFEAHFVNLSKFQKYNVWPLY